MKRQTVRFCDGLGGTRSQWRLVLLTILGTFEKLVF
jgi:hypothetical protein